MVSERLLYDSASRGDVTTLADILNKDPYLVNEVSFPCSRNILHIAAMHGQKSIVEAVLNHNQGLTWRLDSQKSSPLHIAAAEGYVEICQKLLQVAPEACFWRDSHDMNPLHVAAVKGHVEILEYFLQVSPFPAMERLRTGGTVLHLCVKHGQLAALKILVERLEEFVYATDENGEMKRTREAFGSVCTKNMKSPDPENPLDTGSRNSDEPLGNLSLAHNHFLNFCFITLNPLCKNN